MELSKFGKIAFEQYCILKRWNKTMLDNVYKAGRISKEEYEYILNYNN